MHGIFVNRGRIPYEYRDSNMHLTPLNEEQEVEGVLFYSEGEDQFTKGMKVLGKTEKYGDIRINCEEFIGKTELANTELASKVYIKAVSLTLGDKIE